MISRAIVFGGLGVLVMTLGGCNERSSDPPPASPPVVTIRPLTPPPAGNPVVIGVGVSGKDGYAFLNNAPGFGDSKLTMLAKDVSGGSVGTSNQSLLVAGWNDGEHRITLSREQQALYDDRRTKTVVFSVMVICQLKTNPVQKITDEMTFTKP